MLIHVCANMLMCMYVFVCVYVSEAPQPLVPAESWNSTQMRSNWLPVNQNWSASTWLRSVSTGLCTVFYFFENIFS